MKKQERRKRIRAGEAGFAAMRGTKWELFKAAVDLFAAKGYAGVGVREIAAAVDIRSASIYNHFAGKEALLQKIYQFFSEHYLALRLPLEELLALIPTTDPREVLERSLPQLSDVATYDTVKKIMLIVMRERDNDPGAKKIAKELLGKTAARFDAILKEMIRQGVIEPVDTEQYASIFVRFDVAMVLPSEGRRALKFEEWQERRRVLFGLVGAAKQLPGMGGGGGEGFLRRWLLVGCPVGSG